MTAGRRGALVAGLLVVGCSPPRNAENGAVTSRATRECMPAMEAASDSIPLSAISGTFRLTLVATSGAQAGRVATGDLRLDAPSSPARGTGTVAIALDSVGARAPGSASDGRQTIEALTWSTGSGAPRTTIRIGAFIPPAGTRVIEGPYTALTVGRATADGFAGTWESGMPDGTGRAGGHFCADRSR